MERSRTSALQCVHPSGIFQSYLAHFLTPSPKNKKIQPKENFVYFQKWNFLALILRNFLYFALFQERENSKISLYFGKQKPKKLLIFQKM